MAGGAHRRKPGRHRSNSPVSSARASSARQSLASWKEYTVLAVTLVFVLLLLAWKLSSRGTFSFGSGVSTEVSYEDILKSASRPLRNADHRNLNGTVLAYVTPWNSKGYDMAKKYRAKFTHVSPVWYQLKRDDKGLTLMGKHDVDQGWIASVRRRGSPRIVPRVVLEGWPLGSMLLDPEEREKAIQLIVEECKDVGYDGIVLEAWNSWASSRILENQNLRRKALEFVRELGTILHGTRTAIGNRHMQLLFVVPPDRGGGTEEFKRADLEFLKQAVDGFSLMTYDYSNAYRPGPNAPLFWIRSSLHSLLSATSGSQKELASKILLGLNFYGNDFIIPRGGGAILGDQFLDLLKQHKPKLTWDVINREHYCEYTKEQKKHNVYYPSLKSISLRLDESQNSGTGISIWEIGQGLEYFFDLL